MRPNITMSLLIEALRGLRPSEGFFQTKPPFRVVLQVQSNHRSVARQESANNTIPNKHFPSTKNVAILKS
jgi:hypothetical protein